MNKKQTPVHFREEIQTAFVSYAIKPSILCTIFLVTSVILFWIFGTSSLLKETNKSISQTLENSLSSYVQKTRHPLPVPVVEMLTDKGAVSLAYSHLKEFISGQEIKANFVVLDSHLSVIMQGNSQETFRIPFYQSQLEWGFLGRLIHNENKILIEISKDYTSSGLDELLIGRSILSNTNEITGYIIFVITAQDLMERLRFVNIPYSITNKFGNSFASTNLYYLNQYGKIQEKYRIPFNKTKLVQSEAVYRNLIREGVLTVYTIQDVSQLQFGLFAFCIISLLFLVVLILGMVISSKKIARDKSKTIDTLVSAFKDVEAGILNNHISIDTNVEFKTIADAYNKMLEDIQRLFLYERKQLEMQFNPHFLYNTLENTKFMIKLDPDAAQKTIVNLSEILRYSVSNTISQVTIEEDLYYIENYLAICKSRFQKKFSYEIHIPTEMYSLTVPKLFIQPLLENAVKYGSNEKGIIHLSLEGKIVDSCVEIRVSDEGQGLTSEELREVNTYLSMPINKTNHIGLYNVQRRIQLIYGYQYGVHIESPGPGCGTMVTLKIPVTGALNDTDSPS